MDFWVLHQLEDMLHVKTYVYIHVTCFIVAQSTHIPVLAFQMRTQHWTSPFLSDGVRSFEVAKREFCATGCWAKSTSLFRLCTSADQLCELVQNWFCTARHTTQRKIELSQCAHQPNIEKHRESLQQAEACWTQLHSQDHITPDGQPASRGEVLTRIWVKPTINKAYSMHASGNMKHAWARQNLMCPAPSKSGAQKRLEQEKLHKSARVHRWEPDGNLKCKEIPKTYKIRRKNPEKLENSKR